ncbi:unnamed protein product [Phytomonas sp. Hart1]|nr:unnamed protein product [Phytomonas sp. Hart1]|eukprot:CCW68507.1 unnamed protein product [Phytomonas sp. isolate Hart1]
MLEHLEMLASMRPRDYVQQGLMMLMFMSTCLVGWTGLTGLTWCEYSIVAVISGSMEPGYHRGDLLFLSGDFARPVEAGDIVVYRLLSKDIPVVHRVIETHHRADDAREFFLTKGDNNRWDDRFLYTPGMAFVGPEQVIGRVMGKMAYAGYATLMFNGVAFLKWVSVGLIGFLALTSLG